ncbi:uncharacterized protein LOC109202226 isoform X1 [Oreochromis niloticus]|uniref:uncharacterized protein LOC109202226 isoform X1 n=1 Tax=Oreochromis niloticus TaxID=8128 RepID=UPI00022B42B4|nr:uncharacterized protein LOC109202226 isoform X1 [Oreochromis niloticus]CAI5686865.1 unnamed protein product [Mustela putorius furo]
MKAFCAAVLVLNFISVCQPASVACKSYLKKAKNVQDLTGKWYAIAMSSNSCWNIGPPLLSSDMDITAVEKANTFEATITMKMYGQCKNQTTQFHYGNSTISVVNSTDGEDDDIFVFLEKTCRDYVVIKSDDFTDILVLLSRRTSITADEMEAFERQTKCHNLYKPQVFDSDHDYENCPTFEDEKPKLTNSEMLRIHQGWRNMFSQLFTCVQDRVLYYPRAAFQWVQSTWSNLW